MESEFELKLLGGKMVNWVGKNGQKAAERYVDSHKQDTVVAWRPVQHGLFIYNPNIPILE